MKSKGFFMIFFAATIAKTWLVKKTLLSIFPQNDALKYMGLDSFD